MVKVTLCRVGRFSLISRCEFGHWPCLAGAPLSPDCKLRWVTPRDLRFFLSWVRPEIPRAELTAGRTSSQLAVSGHWEGKAEASETDRAGVGWTPGKFKHLILSEAKGRSHFLFYPNQRGSLERQGHGTAAVFPKPSAKCLDAALRHLTCHWK